MSSRVCGHLSSARFLLILLALATVHAVVIKAFARDMNESVRGRPRVSSCTTTC